MATSTLFLATMQALVRHLGQEIHSFQISFVSSVVGLVFLVVLSIFRKQRLYRAQRKRLLIFRGFLLAISNVIYFFALTLTPLVEATSLSFVGVVFAVIISVIFLGESMYFHRWVSVMVTFVGIIAILRPGYIEASLGVYAVLLSSLTWGLALVVAKVLSRTENQQSQTVWTICQTTAAKRRDRNSGYSSEILSYGQPKPSQLRNCVKFAMPVEVTAVAVLIY